MKKIIESTGSEGKRIEDLLEGFDDRYQKLAEEIRANSKPEDMILDVGCGEGKIWQLFPGLDITGLDISEENLKKAGKYLKPVKGPAEKLPFKDQSFDLVIASEILEHLIAPEKVLQEIDRVLKPEGLAIVTYPNTGGLQFRMSLLFCGRNPSLNYPENILHIRFFSLLDFKQMIKKTKLKIQKIRGTSFLAFHKENFGYYIPIPRRIRVIGGDLFPGLSFGNSVILKKEGETERGDEEGLKEKLIKSSWALKYYYQEAERSVKQGFFKNKGLLKLKEYASNAKSVLDCGCGSVSILEKDCHPEGIFYGVDISPMGINLAKKRLKSKKNIKLLVGDLEMLKFEDNYFDLVYSAYVLEHLAKPEKVIREMIRVTKTGGYLIFVAPNYGSPLSHSPSSPSRGETLISRAVKQFIKSHFYLIKKPNDLDWPKVDPICLKKGEYRPDWDTVSEPYLQTLIYFLEKQGVKIVEYKTHLIKEKEKEVVPPTFNTQLLRLVKKLAQKLEEWKFPPYKYFGPDLFVVGQKI